MKFFAFIFCLYLTVLVLIPCSDTDECQASQTEHSIILSTENHNHDSEPESCTPFCLCACCGQSYNSQYMVSLENTILLQGEIIKCLEKEPFIQEVYFSIWQPPKIS